MVLSPFTTERIIRKIISIYRIDPFFVSRRIVACAQDQMKSTSVCMEVSRNVKMRGYILHEASKNKGGLVGIKIGTYTDGNTNRESLSGAKKMEDA